MKAPSPPPTIPSRMRGSAMSRAPVDLLRRSDEPQCPSDLRLVAGDAGEVVEGSLGDADDVVADKGGAFARAVLRVLQTAFPLQHRPAVESDGSQPREDRLEVNLSVAERAKAAGAIDPGLEARIDALPPGRIELRVLDVEGADSLGVNVDEGQIVQLLQDEMGRIVVDRATRVIAGALVEHLEGNAVAHVLAGMYLIAEVDARFLICIEDRTPATREFVERRLDQARRPLRPGIKERPGQRAGKAHAAGEAEAARRLRGLDHLVYRPDLAFVRLAPDCRRCKSVEGFVVGRVNRDELSLQVGGQFGDHQTVARSHAGNFI